MTTLFGRSSADPFFDEALKFLENSSKAVSGRLTVAEQRALARNLRHDTRVSEARQQKFEQFVADSKKTGKEPAEMARSLLDALFEYKYKFVQSPLIPDFVREELNEENIKSAHRLLGDPARASAH